MLMYAGSQDMLMSKNALPKTVSVALFHSFHDDSLMSKAKELLQPDRRIHVLLLCAGLMCNQPRWSEHEWA